jgi:hypothetical protein
MIALLGIAAVSLVALILVVGSGAPLKLMTAFAPKFMPSISGINGPLLAITLEGFKVVMVGIVPGCGGVME